MAVLAFAYPDPSPTPTSEMRVQFTVPANGAVLVRIKVPYKGNAASPMIHLGVLQGSTVMGRMAAYAGRAGGSTALRPYEVEFIVPGLTAGAFLTWDAAYGVDLVQTTANLGWGGPNDTTASNAYGAALFEVWETPGLIDAKLVDPTTPVTKSLATITAMAAMDTGTLRIPLTVPASGNVLARIRVAQTGAAATPAMFLGIMDGSTVKLRMAPLGGNTQSSSAAATDLHIWEFLGIVTDTPGASVNWDAAWSCETAQTGAVIGWGGPNDAVASNTYGAASYELWAA
jgi:hypothetical protein